MARATTLEDSPDSPTSADDLKQIRGIGKGVERSLHQAGIVTFADLAARSPSDLAAILGPSALFSEERLAQQDWPGQARALAAATPESVLPVPLEGDQDRQHYATFKVEFLLTADNRIRRTRVWHIQAQGNGTDPGQWSGWDMARLEAFIINATDLRTTEVNSAVELLPPEPSPEPSEPQAPPAAAPALTGIPRIASLERQALGGQGAVSTGDLRQFSLIVTLDLSEMTLPAARIAFDLTVYARPLASGAPRRVASRRGVIRPARQVVLTLPCEPLAPGLYRLQAVVQLGETLDGVGRRGPTAFLEGVVMQIV